MANSNLTEAKRAKSDEFYTQYADIEKEITAYLEFNPKVFRAWSKGGGTNIKNCQMLCKTHNRAKGNR